MNINLIVFLTNGKIYKALVEIEQNIKNVIFYEKKNHNYSADNKLELRRHRLKCNKLNTTNICNI